MIGYSYSLISIKEKIKQFINPFDSKSIEESV